jgi:hypothetical protein
MGSVLMKKQTNAVSRPPQIPAAFSQPGSHPVHQATAQATLQGTVWCTLRKSSAPAAAAAVSPSQCRSCATLPMVHNVPQIL